MTRPAKAAFVTLFDEATLRLYLANGIYGQHQAAAPKSNRGWQTHFQALGDYASLRGGDHIFFFLDRTLTYGGQVVGSEDHGAFLLNGCNSPWGKATNAPLIWDESSRAQYQAAGNPGVFSRPGLSKKAKPKGDNDAADDQDGDVEIAEPETEQQRAKAKRAKLEVCQPYLIQFKDQLGLAGKQIESDLLYFELGSYPYPLPSNAISGMGFCVMTPGEANIALKLFQSSVESIEATTTETVKLRGSPQAFDPSNLNLVFSEEMLEAEIEACCLAKPQLLPAALRATLEQTTLRQVPISPFKPAQMDRADVVHYSIRRDGTLPDHVVELKRGKLGKPHLAQASRYLAWLDKLHGNDAHGIRVSLLGSGWAKVKQVPPNLKGRCTLYAFDGTSRAL